MNIGSIAKQAKVNVQTLRYYERIGLLAPILRRTSGYRVYNAESVQRVLFIRRAQDLGFTLEDVKELLSLKATTATTRARARGKAKAKLAEIHDKIVYLKKLESTLKALVHDCEHGNLTGPCPILRKMESGK